MAAKRSPGGAHSVPTPGAHTGSGHSEAFHRLREISNALGETDFKSELYARIGEVLDPLFPHAQYSVLLLDPASNRFAVDFSTGVTGHFPQSVNVPRVLHEVVRGGTPFRGGDGDSLPPIVVKQTFLPVLAADVLSHRGAPLGLLALHGHESIPPAEAAAARAWLPVIAEQVAARLSVFHGYSEFEKAAEVHRLKLATLHEAVQLLRQLDLDVLLTKILELSLHIGNAEVGSIMVRDGPSLVGKVEWGLKDKVIAALRRRDGTWLAAEASNEGRMLYLPVLADEPDLDLSDLEAKVSSFLCLPLATKERPLGVVNLANVGNGRELPSQDLEVLQSMTALAGIALENAMLYKDLVERERMAEGMKIAGRIQQSLLPVKAPQVAGLDVVGWTQSCDETGGDYYDFVAAEEHSLGIVIGDVSGHGIASALFMATARAFLRSMVDTVRDPGRLFQRLNAMLKRDMEGERFMTMLLAVLDPAGGRLTYASAGHDPAILFRPGADRFEELAQTGPPLGMFADRNYKTAWVSGLRPGDVIVFSTDGVWESTNAEDEPFGRDRLKALIREHHGRSAQDLVDAIRGAVDAFSGGMATEDDRTLVVVKMVAD